jgi:hypothetical protein
MNNTVYVMYETDCSVICEYMTEMEYQDLKKDELNGSIRIMNHRNICFGK